MDKNLHTLLTGPLYINPMYGVSLLPSIYKSLTTTTVEDKSIAQMMLEKQLAVDQGSVGASGTTIVVVDFNQPVVKFDYGSWLGTKTYTKILDNLKNDDSVAGVVLNIDSGGGQVYGTPEFYDYIKNYPKPIVAYTDGYMCSGAYYIAAATQRIFANKRADAIGSIGAYATLIDTNGIYEHFGAKVHTIYATKSTEKNTDYRNVLENADYKGYIKNQLDPIVETFIEDMKSTRPNIDAEAFKGGTWTGQESLSMGLVDSIGTLQDAVSFVFNTYSKSSNSNLNTNMTTKSLPRVEAVLGLEASLALTDNGSYLNEEQLSTIEASLDTALNENANLQTQLTEAETAQTTAVEAVQTQLTEAQNSLNAVTASVDAIMTAAGLSVEGSLTEKLTAINGKAVAFGKLDGATPTNPRAIGTGSGDELADLSIAGLDVKGALNN